MGVSEGGTALGRFVEQVELELLQSGLGPRFKPLKLLLELSLLTGCPVFSLSDLLILSSCCGTEATDEELQLLEFLLDTRPLDCLVAASDCNFVALEPGLLAGGFASFLSSDCDLPPSASSCGWVPAVFLCERRSDPPVL